MAAKIGGDDTMAFDRIGEDVFPVIAGAREAMKEKQRITASGITVEKLQSVHVGGQ
jgi:hypothetical protein